MTLESPISPPFVVLVIDADPEYRRRYIEAARAAWNQPATPRFLEAGDGVHALGLCREHGPRLVISEILLEGHSGLVLLRQLQAELDPPPPIVFVTELARQSDRYWGLRNGAHAYITKPFEDDALRERIERLLASGVPDRPQ